MDQKSTWIRKWTDRVNSMDINPCLPVIELVGDCRVLIENHCSIIEYGKERIVIKMKFGCVEISGCGMNLSQLTRSQLVIAGRITGVRLARRGT